MKLSQLLKLTALGSCVLAGNLFAATGSIDGKVKDPNGKVMSGADVKIENKGGSAWNKMTKTDATGHYRCDGLNPGYYRVSLITSSQVRASINNVEVKSGETNKLNFDLKKGAETAANTTQAKKKTHMVYIPPETGTNMGGRWVEVDDNGQAPPSNEQVDKRNGNLMLRMQQNAGHTGGGN